MKTLKKFAVGGALFALPLMAFAQGQPISQLIRQIGTWVDLLTPIVVGIALLAFFWGLAKFIFSAGNEDAKDSGKQIMIWGIIALFVMVSVWGIVKAIGDTLGIDRSEKTITPPSVNIQQ